MLRMPGRKSREYARYSPPLAFLSLFSIHGCCNQTLEPRSRSTPEVPTTTWRSPTSRSSSEVPKQEACAFSIDVVICASLLKEKHVYLCLYSDTIASANFCVARAVVFKPSWPLACNIKLVLFYF